MISQNRIIIFTTNWLVNTAQWIKVPTLFLAWAFFLLSCADDELILDVNIGDDEERTEVRQLVVPLPASNFWFDSLSTTGAGRILLGQIEDGDYGQLKASTYFQWNLRTLNPDIGEGDLEVIEFNLKLKPNYFTGEVGRPMQVKIYRLAELLEGNKFYYTNDSIPKATLLGEHQIVINQNRLDQISIPLSQDFATQLLNRALLQDSTFKTVEKFKEFFRGMLIEAESGNNIIGFNQSDSTEIELKYTINEGETERLIRFTVDNSHFIRYQQSGGIIPEPGVYEARENFNLANNKVMLHSGIGLMARVELSPLFAALDTIDHLDVTRADFIIEGIDSSNNVFIRSTLNEFSLPFVTEDNRTIPGNDGNIRSVQAEGNLQNGTTSPLNIFRASGGYVGQTTSFVQAIKNEVVKDVDYILLRPNQSEFRATVNRFVVDQNDIKLVINYTTIK